MDILHGDSVFRVEPGTTPEYNNSHSLLNVLGLVERTEFACDREWYLRDSLQYLFPIDYLELYSPAGQDSDVLDPTRQDNKTDFQKQNVRTFRTSSTALARGWVTTGDWTGPFLRLSYQAGPDSPLWKANSGSPGSSIKLWLKVGGKTAPELLTVPYNGTSDRYEVELWGFSGGDLRSRLVGSSRDAVDRGELQVRNDLVNGSPSDFEREKLNDRDLRDVAPDCTMHPVLPLHVECAWTTADAAVWDSNGGQNYHYDFSMVVRGWDNFLSVGISSSPHGGQGFLEYRNLISNYGRFAGSGELSRQLEPWSFDAFGVKHPAGAAEKFMAVDYMDLHVLKPECGIGLHRHRDNQEVFLMMEGRAYMVVGDWCKMPGRERCLEVRTLRAGHFALLKGGNLHGIMNATDEDTALFMFGGYD
jgi:hypothetical protein